MKLKIPLIIAVTTILVLLVVNQPVRSTGGAINETPIYQDMVVDDSRQLLYVSDQNANAIHVISMDTLEITQTISIGLCPAGMDMNAKGTELAVALQCEAAIAFMDLPTLSVKPDRVEIAPHDHYLPPPPVDVVYGREGRLYVVGIAGHPEMRTFRVIDTETKTEITQSMASITISPRLAISDDKNTLYISQRDTALHRFDVTTDTPVQTAVVSDTRGLDLCLFGDYVVTSAGQVWSADLQTLHKHLRTNASHVACAETMTNLYFSGSPNAPYDPILEAIDADTWQLSTVGLQVQRSSIARLDANQQYLYISTSDGIKKVKADYKPDLIYAPSTLNDYCNPMYYEAFEDPFHYWPVGEDDYVRAELLDNQYRIYTKSADYFYTFRSPACERTFYSVEVDARWVGSPGASYGIIFGIQPDWSQYYLFDVNTNYRLWRLYYRLPDKWVLIDQAERETDGIYWDNTLNHIKVKYYDQHIHLISNNHLIYQGYIHWLDPKNETSAGVMVMPYSNEAHCDVRFDNFEVHALDAYGNVIGGASSIAAEVLPELTHDTGDPTGYLPWPQPDSLNSIIRD